MSVREALAWTGAGAGVGLLAVAYGTVTIPQDGVLDLREAIVLSLLLAVAVVLPVRAWWRLLSERLEGPLHRLRVRFHDARETLSRRR